jgi:hypothetical protein
MNRLLRVRREIGHSGRVPRCWRMAWYEPSRRLGVYYPMPLHWIFRAARKVLYRLLLALRAPGVDTAEVLAMQRAYRHRQKLADEYARGYVNGWRECFAECLHVVEEEITRSDQVWDVGSMLSGTPNLPPAN